MDKVILKLSKKDFPYSIEKIKNPQELEARTVYEVQSTDRLLIPFRKLKFLTIINESEGQENLVLKRFVNAETPYKEIIEYEEGNEPIFTRSCLEAVETEKIGKKTRTFYNFEFKRISFKEPSIFRNFFEKIRLRKEEPPEVGKIYDIDERFFEFLPEVPEEMAQKLVGMSGVLTSENPLELARKVYVWTLKNFENREEIVEGLEGLLQEKEEKGKFFGNCLERSRVFSNTMRAYSAPTTIQDGKLGYYSENGHVWSEICIPVKNDKEYKTMFLPIDLNNMRFGDIDDQWLYFSVVPYIERKTPSGKEIKAKRLKLVFN